MKVLIVHWGFKLAIASAILTIFYPEKFTIYDYRAAGQVNEGVRLKDKTKFEDFWIGYIVFRAKVLSIPYGASLREKDYFLFGKSRMEDLKADLNTSFRK